jgi:hypothetical protein
MIQQIFILQSFEDKGIGLDFVHQEIPFLITIIVDYNLKILTTGIHAWRREISMAMDWKIFL